VHAEIAMIPAINDAAKITFFIFLLLIDLKFSGCKNNKSLADFADFTQIYFSRGNNRNNRKQPVPARHYLNNRYMEAQPTCARQQKKREANPRPPRALLTFNF